jgi:elongation factor Tu
MSALTDPSFRMTVSDTFAITGRGTVVAGHIESGALKIGDEVFVNRMTPAAGGQAQPGGSTKVHVIGIQAGTKAVRDARQGDTVGVVLRGVNVEAVAVGDVLSAMKADT